MRFQQLSAFSPQLILQSMTGSMLSLRMNILQSMCQGVPEYSGKVTIKYLSMCPGLSNHGFKLSMPMLRQSGQLLDPTQETSRQRSDMEKLILSF